MSNNREYNDWDDEEDDDLDVAINHGVDTDLVKKLRKANRMQEKRIKELESSLGDLSKAQRERIVRDVLTSRGVNSKIATFIPSELEASEDAISAWLDANADVFGFQSTQPADFTSEDASSLRQMDLVTQGAMAPDKAEDLQMRIRSASTAEEILSLIQGQ